MPDRSCFGDLAWRLDCTEVQSWPPVFERLVESGFEHEVTRLGVSTFVEARGHKVVVVPTTGRIQIRIDIETPLEERAGVARNLAKQVLTCCDME